MINQSYKKSNIQKKGEIAETRFQEWMDHHHYDYVGLNQTKEMYPLSFIGKTKRPDYQISIKNVGIIVVDVKSRRVYEGYEVFTLNFEEIQKLHSFSMKFRFPAWIVFLITDSVQRTFYWRNVESIREKCPLRTNSRTNEKFFSIDIKECITLGWNDSIGRIIQH